MSYICNNEKQRKQMENYLLNQEEVRQYQYLKQFDRKPLLNIENNFKIKKIIENEKYTYQDRDGNYRTVYKKTIYTKDGK